MRKNIFDEQIDRFGTYSFKWGKTKEIFGEKDLLPMWVADMDFRPPKAVTNAFMKRVSHGIYGYTYTPDSTYHAIQQWVQRRYRWKIDSSWISFSQSVVPAISTAIRAFTEIGDKVMIQSPVYAPFYEMVEKNKREIINCPLKLTNNKYEIDFAAFEHCLKSGVKLFLLCNPHNPGGRVWTKEELTKIGELCIQYECLIFSDDIHADLVFEPYQYEPIASLSEKFSNHVITAISPSKTFNLAGLNAAVVISENPRLKQQFDFIQRQQGFFSLGTFGIIGMEAAYAHGEEWLLQLLAYLKENIAITKRFIDNELPDIQMMEPEGTYLLWLNCSTFNLADEQLINLLLKKGKLALEPGTKYGQGGEGFVRMNIACSRTVLLEGLRRLKLALGSSH